MQHGFLNFGFEEEGFEKEKNCWNLWNFVEIFKILKIRDSSFVALLILRRFI